MSFWGCVLGRGTCSTLEFLSGVGLFFDDFARILVQREHKEHVLNVYFYLGLSARAIRALLLLEVGDFGYDNCGVSRRRVHICTLQSTMC